MTKDRQTRDIQVCCESFRDVVAACEGGAKRIELCSALDVGGLTPSFGLVSLVTQRFPELEISVLIRPRPGNFVYSRDEQEQMSRDIALCRRLEVDGVVVGALTATGNISKSACSRLVTAALGDGYFFPPVDFITFHRAFDVCRKPERALEDIISLGFDRLLTSGQCATALKGAENIAEYIRQARGRITIMPGCGIHPANVIEIEALTGAHIFHASARGKEQIDEVYTNPNVDFGENRPVRHTSATLVQQLINI